MIVYEIECQECNATYEIKHHLNTSRYDIVYCSFCGSDNVEIEEYDESISKYGSKDEIYNIRRT